MKSLRIFVLVLVSLLMAACILPFSATAVPTQIPSPTGPSATQILASATPLASATAPQATMTPTQAAPKVVPTLGLDAATGARRITFEAGGTWIEIGGKIEPGTPQRFVLAAMKGQILSASVAQGWPISIEITSASGKLTDPKADRPFWRGKLPASGDYQVILKTQNSTDFNLRIAINPPGQANQYFDFRDTQLDWSIRYSDEFAPINNLSVPLTTLKSEPRLVLSIILPDIYGPRTNLSEADLLFDASMDVNTVANCLKPSSPMEKILGVETINGYKFTHSSVAEGAAGNLYEQEIYRTVFNQECFESVLFMHSANIGNYPPGTVVEFDRSALMQKFKIVLGSFKGG